MHVAALLANNGRHPFIVAADTIVVLGDEVLMKPCDDLDAVRMLTALSGKTHVVITACAIGSHSIGFNASFEQTEVTFHKLTSEQIRGYVATGEGRDKAGAYAIQNIGAFLVDTIKGDYFNVVGLPISKVVRILMQMGALPEFLKP
jgi:septum formation protein